jgi:hypothetical protein
MVAMQPPPASSPEPGERRRLDHPPSDRYAEKPAQGDAASVGPSGDEAAGATELPARERLLRGVAVGLAGAIAIILLGGPLSVTTGLIAAAGATGWFVGAVMRPGKGRAVAVALGSVALGLAGIWVFAGFEGGVLGPLDYLAEVQGLLVPIELIVAGALAAAAG